MSGSRFMKRDISLVVEELLDEQEEQRRIAADPEHVPVLQVHNLDVSYGPLQVLFDVNVEVQARRGARAARHERRRQVDAAPRDRRAACSPIAV